ncbi:hypothetical protein [Burkholderia stabilis]|uniref:Uncharacterized protein n=1 Tax=Burkholderia stabilis TaxID=95485 RepID=A0A1Y1BMQ3_9BURK|nr:hypothetical protein [Burkholderia stabilis]BAX61272.1 hypothetical protein BSFP_041390 [Burkholderia stabilis]
MKPCDLARIRRIEFFSFIRSAFHPYIRHTGGTLKKHFQEFIHAFLIDEACRFKVYFALTIPQNPDLSSVSSYRIASIRPSSGLFSCPHDSRVKQKRAYCAAIARPCPRTAGLRRPWHADCLISDSYRAARQGTWSKVGAPLVNQRVGEKAMKITTDRSTLASIKHQRGCRRNRSACRGASSTSPRANRRLPKRFPCSGMERVRDAVGQIDTWLVEMLDEGENQE